ncbi:LytTR family DNA-binding domain-containing protein [Sphingobacterium sp. JUb56]|uniref:LytR/AlgR family response regulator transcription factor n=1 Tax=Sphingobacterium sp. JUb56 TaxID=2587145 RepID=UPI001823059A|nr:LytTR family DNA-binding domain-containing protein [Sphingobacterium sp. JUb56]MBB2951109.1 DNA-binding LytR/AlgR family response regulator [Sphingobacterium sp. JUb56]
MVKGEIDRKRYRCIALDDQLYATGIIAAYVDKTPDLTFIKATDDAFDALNMIMSGHVDLVFLDIQMPTINGIQFLKRCGNKCRVILTTAYPDYALQGFDLDVVDYLLKPFSYERFQKAVDKFRLLQLASMTPQVENDYLLLKGDAKNKYYQVKFSDIMFIKGLNNYISVYTKDQHIITYMNLKEIINLIPTRLFCRVHRSYIVSFNYIKFIDGNSLLIDEEKIPISESYKATFYSRLKEF